jgi:hypothetical protein
MDPVLAGTVSAAVKDTLRFHAMPDNPAVTMRAGWRQGMDRTFETVEDMRLTSDSHFKTFVVHIPTYFTSHIIPLLIHYLPLSLIYPF